MAVTAVSARQCAKLNLSDGLIYAKLTQDISLARTVCHAFHGALWHRNGEGGAFVDFYFIVVDFSVRSIYLN